MVIFVKSFGDKSTLLNSRKGLNLLFMKCIIIHVGVIPTKFIVLIMVETCIYLTLLYMCIVKCTLLDINSFLVREKAMQSFLEGKRAERNDPRAAVDLYLRSYSLFANPLAARKLAWLHDMLGNNKLIWEWQQNYVRNDVDSVLVHMNEGIRRHYASDYSEAIRQYELAFNVDPVNPDALYLKGVSYQMVGDIENAAYSYYAAIELDPMHTKAILNLATIHQKYGSFDDSVSYYLKGVEVFRIFEKGGTMGEHEYLHPQHVMLQYNLGLAYYQRNELDKAYSTTVGLIHHLLPIAQAVGDPLQSSSSQKTPESLHVDANLYDAWEITQSMGGALGSLSKIQRAALYWGKWEELHDQLLKYTLLGISHSEAERARNTNTVTDSSAAEVLNTKIVYIGPLLPFDTLMMQLPLAMKLFIGQSASMQYTYVPFDAQLNDRTPLQCMIAVATAEATKRPPEAVLKVGEDEHQQRSSTMNCNRKLKLGFISYDFNDHPTAHLIEAIFRIINSHATTADSFNMHVSASTLNNTSAQSNTSRVGGGLYDQVELVIFSYGKDDSSVYRKNLRSLAHKFVDIVESTFTSAAETIRAEKIDILLDLQIHTLGSRLEITASGVAPVVINYLVYPGTSGAKFYNYIICDPTVVPAEHSAFYSEALLMLPPTYQISTYEVFAAQQEELAAQVAVPPGASVVELKTALRRRYNLPQGPEDVIFCNFNKINKIDAESFALWVQVMRTVPHSYLWLLDPSKEGDSIQTSTKHTLLRSFVAAGVAEKRILFAPRMGKNAHIFRHGAADLFLDTIVYGAHSTATDALRGGLPVLTLCGDSFPSRVASSLYESFAYRHLHHLQRSSPLHPSAPLTPVSSTAVPSETSFSSSPAAQATAAAATTSAVSTAASAVKYLKLVLVVDSAKEFVDTAARLVQHRNAPHSGRAAHTAASFVENRTHRLSKDIRDLIAEQAGLFDAERNVRTFVYAMEAVQEAAAVDLTAGEVDYNIVVL